MPDIETLEKICKTAVTAVSLGYATYYGLILYRANQDKLPTRDISDENRVQTFIRDMYELVTTRQYKAK
jgi:hypothetical protein